MGFEAEFNWILKLDLEKKDLENLTEGKIVGFEKLGVRIYPVHKNIFLADENWNALGYVKIERSMYESGRTVGEYKLGRIFNGKESEVLTKIFREMYGKGQNS